MAPPAGWDTYNKEGQQAAVVEEEEKDDEFEDGVGAQIGETKVHGLSPSRGDGTGSPQSGSKRRSKKGNK